MMDILNQISESPNKMKFPQIMGILNVTEDSFSDGGYFIDRSKAVDYAFQLIEDGAHIIDIGGESTRPGAASINLDLELERTIPLIQEIRKSNKDIIISIDTTKYEVAKEALNNGAHIINDISGLQFEPRFLDLALEYQAELVIMHMQGNPRTMQINPIYNNIIDDIYNYFLEKIELCNSKGFSQIIIDVGIGFGKTLNHNLELLKNLNRFDAFNTKKLLGISRKSFIGKIFNIENPVERDFHTLLLHALLLKDNIDIIRVHNVKYLNLLKKTFMVLQDDQN